jgi:tol-pal system protein YbgF
MSRLLLSFSSPSCLKAVVLFGSLWTTAVQAQSPLDVRVLSERVEQLERQLSALQGQGRTSVQMPVSPEQTGTDAQDLPTDVASRLQVRVLQLERLVETLTGQVEEARFELSRLRSETQRLSNDVSYRLAVLEQAAGISSAVAAVPDGAVASTQGQPNVSDTQQIGGVLENSQTQFQGLSDDRPEGRIEPDMNMPMSRPVQAQPQVQQPGRAGQPTAASSGVSTLAPGDTLTAPPQPGPVNQGNTFGVLRTDEDGTPLPAAPGAANRPVSPPAPQASVAPPVMQAAPSPGPVAAATIGTASSANTAFVALPDGTPQQQYDYAFDILRQADYDRAERALRLFLETNSTDDLAGNAQYWLGETYYVRGDFEQAAVEFLSGYQTYPTSSKGPDNLLKLGLSMARLGQTDGACTALTRLATEYPSASDTIRRRAQTERARLKCS